MCLDARRGMLPRAARDQQRCARRAALPPPAPKYLFARFLAGQDGDALLGNSLCILLRYILALVVNPDHGENPA